VAGITVNILADAKYPLDRKEVRKRIETVLTEQRLTENVELAVFVVGKRKMTQLHQEFMQLPGPTDVLSFPLNDPTDARAFVGSPDGVLRLGDIVICYPVAREQAIKKQVTLDRELQDLAEHGLWHLLGYHHE